jgi:hypothetical protein
MAARLKRSGVLTGRGPGLDVKTVLMFRGDALSIKMIAAVWDLRVGNSTDKLVLVALADYANEKTGRCWPSITALVARTELGKRTVLESLKRLQAAGHIEVTHRHRRSSMFKVRQPHPTPALGAPAAPSWVQMNAFLGAAAAPRTVIDPSIEPLRRSKSVSAEDRELDARARDICFRVRMSTESTAQYRAAMQEFEKGSASTSVAYLLEEARRRRS